MVKIILLITAILFNSSNSLAEENYWQKKNVEAQGAALTSVAIGTPSKFFISTDKAVYTTDAQGNSWQRLAFLPKATTKINDIACIGKDNLQIYIATTKGLYRIINDANKAGCIFKGWGNKNDVLCIKCDNAKPDNLYAGTRDGLFLSNDSGRHWKPSGYFKHKIVNDIAFMDNDVFAAAYDGIYKGDISADTWSRIFVEASNEADANENDIENDIDTEESELSEDIINCITIDIDTKAIYIAANKALLVSHDRGNSWQRLTTLPYCVKRIAFDKTNKCIYAVTTNGLYSYTFKDKTEKKVENKNNYADFIKRQIEAEPNIQHIQKAAIEYAEVSPNKIKNMREAAKNKAWMPKLGLGLNYDADNNIDIDRGGTNDRDVFIVGPENRDWGYDVSLSWDLGELIWSDDQTNIDVRSKLMVQLRDDILTEATGLYFERRRLQFDIAGEKYQGKSIDAAMLHLQELTARIDALTGGYLSQNSIEEKL